MCHVFMATGKQPIENDVPMHLGMILEAFPSSRVVEEKKIETPGEILKEMGQGQRQIPPEQTPLFAPPKTKEEILKDLFGSI